MAVKSLAVRSRNKAHHIGEHSAAATRLPVEPAPFPSGVKVVTWAITGTNADRKQLSFQSRNIGALSVKTKQKMCLKLGFYNQVQKKSTNCFQLSCYAEYLYCFSHF